MPRERGVLVDTGDADAGELAALVNSVPACGAHGDGGAMRM